MHEQHRRSGQAASSAIPVRAVAAFLLAAALVAVSAAIALWFAWCSHSASTDANPHGLTTCDTDGFPIVDWHYWTAVNPDVVGWVSVPGTRINSAIVQAPADDPTYYLSHDIRRNANHLGCPYLDATCASTGLLSGNAVVFGHHIKYGAPMFADFAAFASQEFARTHAVILLQTPFEKRMLTVSGAAIINGYDQTKRTTFADQDDFAAWYADRMNECCVQLDSAPAESCVTFVTCSYTRYSNERTLVYAT
ncbi:class B sortase [Adlercreutzia murintestinalis]|uniref:class B sortase n=1 Tax=Adlercreutzia murintestinalis TaxID=2941325 RepID=UPI00203D6FEF|nr:class B sortase [Adlercreutzia murintestinalis]